MSQMIPVNIERNSGPVRQQDIQGNQQGIEGNLDRIANQARVSNAHTAPSVARANALSSNAFSPADVTGLITGRNQPIAASPPQHVPEPNLAGLFLPAAGPGVDKSNHAMAMALGGGQTVAGMPEKVMADIASDFLSAYGKSCPFTDVAGLKAFTVQGKPFLQHMQDIIRNSRDNATPAQLREKAEAILKPELGRSFLRYSLAQKAGEMGVNLSARTLDQVLEQVLDGIANAAGDHNGLISLKDVTSPDKAGEMLAQASNLDAILAYYDTLPDLKSALLSSLEQKAKAMELKHLTPESREKVAQAVYDAVNAYSKKNGTTGLPELTDKADPAVVMKFLDNLQNVEAQLAAYDTVDGWPDLQSALKDSLKQKATSLGLTNLKDKHLENLAKSVYDAVNASNRQYGAETLPKLTGKCDPAFIKDMLDRLENLEDVLRTEALKTALQEGGPLPTAYEKALNGLLRKMGFWPAKGLPKDAAALLQTPLKELKEWKDNDGFHVEIRPLEKTVGGLLLEAISKNASVQPGDMRGLLLKPLFDTFVTSQYKLMTRDDDMKQWGLDHYGPHVTGLQEDQKNAIGFYKDKGYRQINSFLRGINKNPIDESAHTHLNNLKTIYHGLPPCGENVLLYRSDHTQQWFNNAIGNAEWDQAEGMTFTLDKAFLSTALRQEATKVFQKKPKKSKDPADPITYKILYPQGTKTACYLDCLDHKHTGEREMLFKPEAKFKILMADTDRGEVTLLALDN